MPPITKSNERSKALKRFEDHLVGLRFGSAGVLVKKHEFTQSEVNNSVLKALERGFHEAVAYGMGDLYEYRKAIEKYKPDQNAIDRILSGLSSGPDPVVLSGSPANANAPAGNRKWAYAALVSEFGSADLVSRKAMALAGENADQLREMGEKVAELLRLLRRKPSKQK